MTHPEILAPNYTQIPNVVFDYWMQKLKPTEFTVLMCLCRKIFGWHKTSDSISLNQIVKMTGLSKNSVLSALKELEGHGLVLKIQSVGEYGNMPNEFRLNVTTPKDELYTDKSLEDLKAGKRWGDYHQIEGGVNQNLGGGSSNSDLGVVQNLNKGVVQNLHPQKKDYTKERLTKERERESPPAFSASSAELEQKEDKSKNSYGELSHVKLTDEEHSKLVTRLGKSETDAMIKRLDLYVGQTGKKYKSHYATILKWLDDDSEKSKKEGSAPISKHRQGSKLAFETQKDTWKPPESKAKEKTPEEKARIAKEFGVNL